MSKNAGSSIIALKIDLDHIFQIKGSMNNKVIEIENVAKFLINKFPKVFDDAIGTFREDK